jgi:hypothetical protein
MVLKGGTERVDGRVHLMLHVPMRFKLENFSLCRRKAVNLKKPLTASRTKSVKKLNQRKSDGKTFDQKSFFDYSAEQS